MRAPATPRPLKPLPRSWWLQTLANYPVKESSNSSKGYQKIWWMILKTLLKGAWTHRAGAVYHVMPMNNGFPFWGIIWYKQTARLRLAAAFWVERYGNWCGQDNTNSCCDLHDSTALHNIPIAVKTQPTAHLAPRKLVWLWSIVSRKVRLPGAAPFVNREEINGIVLHSETVS